MENRSWKATKYSEEHQNEEENVSKYKKQLLFQKLTDILIELFIFEVYKWVLKENLSWPKEMDIFFGLYSNKHCLQANHINTFFYYFKFYGSYFINFSV